MNKLLEKFLYSFGLSCSNTKSPQLDFIKNKIPRDFKNKKMVDLGCGDGRMTEVLAAIFQAKDILAVDYISSLVNSAKRRGLKAKVIDLEKDNIRGELGVMWGVLHHLPKRQLVLKKLAKNFDYLFIREEINRFKLFEIGDLMLEEELQIMYESAFGKNNIEIVKDNKHQVLFLFYRKPKKS